MRLAFRLRCISARRPEHRLLRGLDRPSRKSEHSAAATFHTGRRHRRRETTRRRYASSSRPACTQELAEQEEDCPGATTAIVREDDYRYRLNRSVLACWISPKSKRDRFTSCSRIVPSLVDGRPAGFKIFALRRCGPLERLGFQNGDRVLTVSGWPIGTPEEAVHAYRNLSSARQFTVEIERYRPHANPIAIQLTSNYRPRMRCSSTSAPGWHRPWRRGVRRNR